MDGDSSDAIPIPLAGSLDATIRPPGSKSITNRALVIASMAVGTTVLRDALDSEDTRVMLQVMRDLGLTTSSRDEGRTLILDGQGGVFPRKKAELYVANSGTTLRFLTASLAFTDGTYRLYGKPRMHERPIGDLIAALETLGGRITCEQKSGYPPIRIHGSRSPQEHMCGQVESKQEFTEISGDLSSQFLSGLLMAAPLASRDAAVRIDLNSVLVSKPYILLTMDVMESFGVKVQAAPALQSFLIPQASVYQPRTYSVEPDASAAGYFFAAAVVAGGTVTVEGLSQNSLQGDVRFVDALERMGATVDRKSDSISVTRPPDKMLRGIDIDMNSISDTAQTLGVVALFADGPTTISGIAHARLKETDRISALAKELRKFDAFVEEHSDGLTIRPPERHGTETVEIETYDDHRMAMSFAIAGLRRAGVVIRDPGCTVKTYPQFFEDLARVCKPKKSAQSI